MEGSPVNVSENTPQSHIEVDALLAEINIEKIKEDQYGDVFVTEIEKMMGPQITSILDDQIVNHAFIKQDSFAEEKL